MLCCGFDGFARTGWFWVIVVGFLLTFGFGLVVYLVGGIVGFVTCCGVGVI